MIPKVNWELEKFGDQEQTQKLQLSKEVSARSSRTESISPDWPIILKSHE